MVLISTSKGLIYTITQTHVTRRNAFAREVMLAHIHTIAMQKSIGILIELQNTCPASIVHEYHPVCTKNPPSVILVLSTLARKLSFHTRGETSL